MTMSEIQEVKFKLKCLKLAIKLNKGKNVSSIHIINEAKEFVNYTSPIKKEK